ncbi:MAG: tetratricopeptide repeat protein [Nitrospinae bacterium]|nr:tetratricopeptide repeat protein [Nitrospinota bacterium]
MPFEIGERIGGRFEIHRIFGGAGKSGMGVVYVCYDHEKGGVLALKTYQEGFFYDKALLDSFKRGALAWIHLDRHPNVVQAYGVFQLGGRLYLGLEYIAPDQEDRNNLTHYLRGKISLEKALRWGVQFCDAIEHARLKGITPHRDIKPDNLMVTRTGDLKVSDFDLAGIGKLAAPPADSQGSPQAAHGLSFINAGNGKVVAGTPPWMAPEQFEGETDVRSDIYSFGVTLYQMAAKGQLPIVSDDGDWRSAHLKQTPEPLKNMLWPIIQRCLDKNPAKRFGGSDPASGFVELRDTLVQLWEREMPNMPVPEPPVGRVFEAKDHCERGVSFAELGLHDQALREYKKAIELDPDYPVVYLNAGASLAHKGIYKEAVKAYAKALKLNPDMAEAYANYGAILKEEGKLDEAEKAYRKAISLKPELAGAYETLGIILSETGRNEEAITIIRKAVEKDSSNPGHHYALGVSLERGKKPEEAFLFFQQAVRLAPSNPHYLYGLGNSFRMLGNMQGAVEAWQECAAMDPKHSMVRFNLGIAYERAGYLDGACSWYEAAIKADPKDPSAYYNYGLLLANATIYGDAADAFEKFAQYATPELAQHVETAKGNAASLRGEEERYQKLMADMPEAVYNRGLANLNLGRLAAAKPFLDKANAMRQGYGPALCGLGIWHEKSGDFTKAAECYRRSISSAPDYVVAWNNLGWASYNLGDLKTAREAYEKYLAVAPPEQKAWADGARQVLAEIKAKLAQAR